VRQRGLSDAIPVSMLTVATKGTKYGSRSLTRGLRRPT
jgi:hypothetical protein